jgi:inner membrane transporter RhtA
VEPAAAAVAAMILLEEFLSLVQWLAMACVMIASIGATRTSTTLEQPAPD